MSNDTAIGTDTDMGTDTAAEIPAPAGDPSTAPVEAPESPAEPPAADTGTDGLEEDQGDETGGNREAAKYRHRAKAAEAERDALANRLEAMQRTEAERLAGQVLAKPAALWVGGAELADLLDAEGQVDPVAVHNRANKIREEFGVEPPRGRHVVPREGQNPQYRPSAHDDMLSVVMGRNG